ncbi:tripartite tricarboxylate transporter permease [Bosea sp. (in: a-proteobacteria)]|jgi:putative tricarboxylic transport membrane protein|uniref:tripartite tricarboxylate transporter permease n=1 Tax=Bosea sp. (in: a-proteobacteria) TaxID=1871050 RepID=UPI003F708813
MSDILQSLGLGLSVAVTPTNLWYCFLGSLIGTLIGVLPGLGPIATMAMLLPLTYYLEPTAALIMLAGIYYGAQYGGSTTAILMRLPGESSSVVTCLDGYEMARKGRAGAALATAALASFFAGTVTTLLIAFFSPPLTAVAQQFGPAEYFSLMVLGLIAAVVFAHGSLLRSIAMILLGLLLGLVGADVNTGLDRFTFGFPELRDGIGIAVISMGVFGIAEIALNLGKPDTTGGKRHAVSALRLTREDFRAAWPAAVRGTGLGALLGILPGGSAMMGSFAAYSIEKKISATPERFGHGAIEGVAGPEAANNAGAQASFIPMLALGIPSNSVMAMMAGAMLIHGIAPSPNLATAQPSLFWGLIASMWIGNLMLLVINLPMIGLWVRLLAVPYRLLFPAILLFCCIGIYTVNSSVFEVALLALFGLAGVVFALLKCPLAPLVLAFILGPLMEENLRRAMLLSNGNATIFLSPISLTLLIAAAVLLALILLPSFRRVRAVAVEE